MSAAPAQRELRALLGEDRVLAGSDRAYLSDATESRNVLGRADAVVLPHTAGEVAEALRWCYRHDVPLIPRGGGTGVSAGAVPLDGGVVLSTERLRTVEQLDPGLWRTRVQAGVTTAGVRRRARESGLIFPPDPGAAEQSQIGGNIATNAGGPHAFKYGVTGAWVMGLELVLAPGELVSVGGPVRKDVAGYDIKSLMIGSEGTLGIVTSAWLRLLPAPELSLPVVAFYAGAADGCAAIEDVLGSGIVPGAIEYFDQGAVRATATAFPEPVPAQAGFMLVIDVDGTRTEATRARAELIEAVRSRALAVHAPESPGEVSALWRWREGTTHAVIAQRGGKVSEDIVVPVDRLEQAIAATVEIGRRHDLPACSWGHAGDGNLHSTFMIDRSDPNELERAERAAADLFAMACELGGSVSGEHGLGWVKRGALALQWPPRALDLHEQIKRVFDPKGLLNPGKKLARWPPGPSQAGSPV